MNDINTDQLDHLRAEAQEVAVLAAPLFIVSEDNLHDASEALARCARITKDSEGLRKAMTKPILDAKANIDRLFKEAVAPVAEAEQKLRLGINAFNTRRERERQDRERAARAVLAQRQREAEADRAKLAEAVGVPVEDMPVMDLTTAVVVEPLETEVVTASGSITTRPVTKVAIAEPDRVPRQWCVPDVKAIEGFCKEAVKSAGLEEARRTISAAFNGAVEVTVELTTVVKS